MGRTVWRVADKQFGEDVFIFVGNFFCFYVKYNMEP